MATNAPNLYLDKVIKLLTSTRGLGRATRIREGGEAYSTELDFQHVDEATATSKLAWASTQAPYAEMNLIPATTTTRVLTVFVRVDPTRLALYLAEQVWRESTGQTWETATGALPAFIKQAINETAGASWERMLNRLHVGMATLCAALNIIAGDADIVLAAEVVHEAIEATVVSEEQAQLAAALRKQVELLHRMIIILETSDSLTNA